MNIQEIGQKCKDLLSNDEVFTTALIVLVGVTAFGLGRASVVDFGPSGEDLGATVVQDGVEVQESDAEKEGMTVETIEKDLGTYVASKNGTRYHFPWCSGAQNIKEENKVWFDTKEAAEAAGYTPAKNCKGL